MPIPCGDNWDKAVDIILAKWSKVGTNFTKLKTMFGILGQEHVKLNDAVFRDLKMIEGRASLMDDKIFLLKAWIGHHATALDAGTKTAWNAIAEIHNKMDSTTSTIHNMTETFEQAGSIAVTVHTLGTNLNELKNDYESLM